MSDTDELLPPVEVEQGPREKWEPELRGKSTGKALRVECHFPDFESFRAQACYGASTMAERHRSSRRTETDSDPWSGTRTMADCAELSAKGWAEGADAARKSFADISRVVGLVRQREPLSDVTGDTVDVGAFLAGVPECWTRYSHGAVAPGRGDQVIRIILNVSASCGIETQALMDRGVAALGLALALDAAGLPSEIIGLECMSSGHDIAVVSWGIKSAAAGFDLARVAYALGHPSVLRRLVFSLEEQWPADARSRYGIPGGYGYPADPPGITESESLVYLPCMHGSESETFNNPERRMEWIKAQMRKFGVEYHGQESEAAPAPDEDEEK